MMNWLTFTLTNCRSRSTVSTQSTRSRILDLDLDLESIYRPIIKNMQHYSSIKQKKRPAMILILEGFLLMYFAHVSGIENHLEITTPSGTFRGTVLASLQGHLVTGFVGIPYALPPVGKLRFAKPQPYPHINGVYNATTIPPVCIQPKGVDIGSPGQEDCLYLNVFVPVHGLEEDKEKDKGLKKVFVFIHGGGFFMGSANEHVPADFVARGDVIAVTFNYRLSWLGFLKGDTPELPGNQGMWDQLMALNWVKDNIKSFGGDPDSITVGGNSMGGESVSALSIISQGKGLFAKGFVMSGAMFTCRSTPGSSDVLLDMLTDRIGCKNEKFDTEIIVQCLRDLPAEKFVLPLENEITNKFTTIDGELFPAPIKDLIRNKRYLEDVGFYARDYLVTVTNNEGDLLFRGPFSIANNPDELNGQILSERIGLPAPVCDKVMEFYKHPDNHNFHPTFDVFADPIIAVPTFKFIETFAEKQNEPGESINGKIYFLLFDHSPPFMPPPQQGTPHGVDMTYIFDLTPKEILKLYYNTQPSMTFMQEDYKLKNVYINILADFMKTGNPGLTLSKEFNLTWPAFDLESENYLNFKPVMSIKQFPMKSRRKFWDETLPLYMEAFRKSQPKEEL